MSIPVWIDKKILIVEDDEISLEYLAELLAPTNVQIIVAKDGREAIEKCTSANGIDLILMDVRLPNLSGREAMLEIKKHKPEVPVIAQTAFAMSGDKEKYINLGFDDYISKPIIMEEMMDVISRFFL